MLLRNGPKLFSNLNRAIELSYLSRIQIPRVIPAISAKQITAHSISSYNATIEFGKSKSIIAPLITLYN
jgi:hypothetical protein